MLHFFIILLTNIFTGVIIYLVLTIRLEKKSSTYEQEKIRREFEEVIRDFNSSAERNISLLENRINIMKKLLKQSGSLSSIDVETIDEIDKIDAPDPGGKTEEKAPYTIVKDIPAQQKKSVHTNAAKRSQYSFLVDEKIDLTVRDIPEDEDSTNVETADAVQTDLIRERYESSGEKHDMLVSLYSEGVSVTTLSESIGLSTAEIELILNLNGINIQDGDTAHGL